jgi:hypothetical protein
MVVEGQTIHSNIYRNAHKNPDQRHESDPISAVHPCSDRCSPSRFQRRAQAPLIFSTFPRMPSDSFEIQEDLERGLVHAVVFLLACFPRNTPFPRPRAADACSCGRMRFLVVRLLSRLAARGMTCGNWRRRRVRGWLRQDEQNRRRCERMLEPSARAKDGEKQAVGRHYFDQGLVSCDVCAVARALPGRSRGRGLSPPFHWGRRSPSGAFGQPLPRWASRRSGACRREGKSGKSCLQAQTQPSFASAPVS